MSNKKYYYKVVNKNLQSCTVDNIEDYCVQYKLNEWVKTKRNKEGLLVFNTLHNAKIYYDILMSDEWHTGEFKIFKCECRSRLPLHYRLAFLISNSTCITSVVHAFIIPWTESWPQGTLSFEQVKLIEEVKIS